MNATPPTASAAPSAAWTQTAWRLLIVTAAYAVSGRLGLLLAIPPGYATAVWPASGVALAAVLLWGPRMWPGILLGSFLVNIATSWDGSTLAQALRSMALALAIGAGATVQALVGGWLIRRVVGFHNIFTQEADVIRILMLGGPLACAVNASMGVGSLWSAGLIPDENFLFNWWTWWVGDSIGVLIFMPLICAWSLRPGARWRREQLALSVPLGMVFAAVVVLFFYVSQEEQKRLAAQFDAQARAHGTALQKAVDADLQMLSALKGFYAASQSVTREEFHTFVAGLLPQYPTVQGLGWAPRVESANLSAFEQAMRAGGQPDYRVYDLAADGGPAPPQARAAYFPLAFVFPRSGNEGANGYDITSEPLRRDAVERALRSRAAAVTSRVHLVQDAQKRDSILIYRPLYRDGASSAEPPLGIASAMVRLDELARQTFVDLSEQGLQLRVLDSNAARSELFTVGPATALDESRIARTLSLPIRVADRKWNAQFILPADYLVAHRSWQAWGLLAVGLSLTALLEVLLLVLLARQSKVEELVTLRTAELQNAEQRFRGLLEAAPDAMVMIDDQGRIELVNRQTEQLFGYARTELVGQSIELLVPERFRAQHAGHRSGYFHDPRARQMGANLDLSARCRDGSEFPVEISFGPVRIGERIYAVAAVRDVSERRAVQRQLGSYARELERSNKELEQFAYVASHDLQAPLRGVLSFAQLLRQRYLGKVLEGKGVEFVQHIEHSAQHMESLIRDLLAFSRVGRQDERHTEVDGEQLLAEVETQLAAVVRERDAIIEHTPLPLLRGSRIELFQLLQNLISNGLKFQPGARPRVRVSAERDGAMWRLSVQDFGIGIAPKDQERIFGIFQRLHPSTAFEGTGIGLAICQKIAAGHGGRIWVASSADQGATFHVTLPAA